MMTELQLSEIRHYLLSKKLPIDILLEVQDHFVSQIQDLMKEKHPNFEEAFEETKTNWSKDLKLSWNGSLDLEDCTPFMRRMRKQIFWDTAKKSLQYSLISIAVMMFSAHFFRKSFFEWTVYFVVGFPFLYALYQYIRNYRTMELWRKYPNFVLTLHQTSIFLFFSVFAILINFFRMFFEAPEKLQQTLKFQNPEYSFAELLLLISLLTLLIGGNWLSIISQQKYLQQIEKIEPFLKYLN